MWLNGVTDQSFHIMNSFIMLDHTNPNMHMVSNWVVEHTPFTASSDYGEFIAEKLGAGSV